MVGSTYYDVVVVGGGVAGVAAACAAADAGASVCLLERYGTLGGVATVSGVGTICGLYLRSQRLIAWGCSEFAQTFAERHILSRGASPLRARDGLIFLPYEIPLFHSSLYSELNARKITVCLHSTVIGAELTAELIAPNNTDSNNAVNEQEATQRITALKLLNWNMPSAVTCNTVIDASGEALIPMLLGLPCDCEGVRQAPSLSIGVRGLPLSEDERSLNVVIAHALLSSEFGVQYGSLAVLPGSKRDDHASLKYTPPKPLLLTDSPQHSELELSARQSVAPLLEALKQIIPQLKNLAQTWVAPQLGFRTGTRPICKESLTAEAVLTCQKPATGVAIGSWPIEMWGENARAEFSYFAEEDYFTVPAGALQARDVTNLFFCGRGICGDERAVAASRVIGTAMGTGYAAGLLASR